MSAWAWIDVKIAEVEIKPENITTSSFDDDLEWAKAFWDRMSTDRQDKFLEWAGLSRD